MWLWSKALEFMWAAFSKKQYHIQNGNILAIFYAFLFLPFLHFEQLLFHL